RDVLAFVKDRVALDENTAGDVPPRLFVISFDLDGKSRVCTFNVSGKSHLPRRVGIDTDAVCRPILTAKTLKRLLERSQRRVGVTDMRKNRASHLSKNRTQIRCRGIKRLALHSAPSPS